MTERSNPTALHRAWRAPGIMPLVLLAALNARVTRLPRRRDRAMRAA
jgi:hypothetical protein